MYVIFDEEIIIYTSEGIINIFQLFKFLDSDSFSSLVLFIIIDEITKRKRQKFVLGNQR